ncbi:MAG: N-6 DNA methylase [Cucumibacter sp.]
MPGGPEELDAITDRIFAFRPVPKKKNSAPFRSTLLSSEKGIVALALALWADAVGTLTPAEAALVKSLPSVPAADVNALRSKIRDGGDPLGEAFCDVRSQDVRRESGAVYTPYKIVEAMLGWAATIGVPDRIVDPGAGSGRFLIEAGRQFKKASLVAVEIDPLAALMTRANLAAVGMADRSSVLLKDFRAAAFEQIEGKTLYIGNPPYVRHHLIDSDWKNWLKEQSAHLTLKASSLAGLHVYFFLAIARWAKAGDYGALITASEWLDVNYGQLVRDLFLNRLGGQAVYVIEPEAEPFPGTQSTAAVTTFKVNGTPPSARFARINKLDDLDHLSGGRRVSRERLIAEPRWSHFTHKPREIQSGYVELGELCRVHRGQVTGSNRVWIAGKHSEGLTEDVLFPTITKAKELFRAGQVLKDGASLRRVIDLPVDLSELPRKELAVVQAFLERAEAMGAKDNFTSQHRKAWWSVGLREPAPILATYMARRPPAFVLNRAAARHLNIAHGLYPREPLTDKLLRGLVKYLSGAPMMDRGRVYAGGLTKFEPREMERIPVPGPAVLAQMAT